jgi:hypothetical protein
MKLGTGWRLLPYLERPIPARLLPTELKGSGRPRASLIGQEQLLDGVAQFERILVRG